MPAAEDQDHDVEAANNNEEEEEELLLSDALESRLSEFMETINAQNEKIALLEASNENVDTIMSELAALRNENGNKQESVSMNPLRKSYIKATHKDSEEDDEDDDDDDDDDDGKNNSGALSPEPATNGRVTSRLSKNGFSIFSTRIPTNSIHLEHNLHDLSWDAYTYFYTSPFMSVSHWLAKITFFLQCSILSLFFLDIWSNLIIPPNVDGLVRICQAIAILVSFFAETDIRTSLRSIIYREGFQEIKVGFDCFTTGAFLTANALMLLQGLLGQFIVFLLIVYSDNIFDLLLNFTAVMFVSHLDELIFALAFTGYAGKRTEKLSKKIQSIRFPPRYPKGFMKYLHLYLYAMLIVCANIGFGIIARQQTNNKLLDQVVKVSFGDEVNPSLGLYSGCYQLQPTDGFSVRVKYAQTSGERGQGGFLYCQEELYKTWVFHTDQSVDACRIEPAPALRSSQERPSSFQLLDTKVDQWLLPDGNPISSFLLQGIEPENVDNECGALLFEQAGTDKELCPVLVVKKDLLGFSGIRKWSREFDMLLKDAAVPVQFYVHPVFIGTFSETHGYEIMFFTGHRWVLGSTVNMVMKNKNPDDFEAIVALFEQSTFWLEDLPPDTFEFVSEPVPASNDQGTPLGLRWHHSRYVEGEIFPYADISRPSDAIFQCGKCSAKNNPCLYEGACLDDGTCLCKYGASGNLCDIKPLGDGECNPYFNLESDEYDEGDCCVASCAGQSCGAGELNFAFGQELERGGTGFPYCVDPSMVPMSIRFNTNIDDEENLIFFSYTLEIRCGVQEVPLRVVLDPLITGESSQEILLADQTSSCVLSFFSIQSWSELTIAFQVLDGSFLNSPTTYVMKEANVTVDGAYELPALYSRCLKEILVEFLEPWYLYSGSYQDEAVAWLDEELTERSNCNNQEFLIERYSLVSMYFAEAAPETWITVDDHCLWSRVACQDHRVVELTHDGMTNGELIGILATELGLLTNLERIDVFYNRFQSTMPTELGHLTYLKFLDLSEDHLVGPIPSELGSLAALKYIGINMNYLSGPIPTELGVLTTLAYIDFDNNELSGDIPSEIGFMKALDNLRLQNNYLSGPIPSEMGTLQDLVFLDLRSNMLTGSIPTEMGNLSALTQLRLGENLITGSIPTELASMASLQRLYLSGNDLTGPIPTTLSAQTTLTRIFLQENQLTGSIHKELGALTSLSLMALNDNMLTGSLSSTIGNMTSLEFLDVTNNDLTGLLPVELGLLTDLKALYLGGNGLVGTIPSEIGLLSNLRSLVLKDNILEGTIPTEMIQLTNIINLQVGGNLLEDESVTELLRALGVFFECDDGTTVELTLQTDSSPEEMSWELFDGQGLVAASGGEYEFGDFKYEKKYCVSADACQFTLYDSWGDGGGSAVISRLDKTYSLSGRDYKLEVTLDICEVSL